MFLCFSAEPHRTSPSVGWLSHTVDSFSVTISPIDPKKKKKYDRVPPGSLSRYTELESDTCRRHDQELTSGLRGKRKRSVCHRCVAEVSCPPRSLVSTAKDFLLSSRLPDTVTALPYVDMEMECTCNGHLADLRARLALRCNSLPTPTMSYWSKSCVHSFPNNRRGRLLTASCFLSTESSRRKSSGV